MNSMISPDNSEHPTDRQDELDEYKQFLIQGTEDAQRDERPALSAEEAKSHMDALKRKYQNLLDTVLGFG